MTSNILQLALKEVQKSQCIPFKVVAIIFKGKRILSIGINKIRSAKRLPSRYMEWKCSLHAEMDAVLQCGVRNCRHASILVLRINKNGKIGMARPCTFCYSSLKDAGFKDMYYSVSSGEIRYEKI